MRSLLNAARVSKRRRVSSHHLHVRRRPNSNALDFYAGPAPMLGIALPTVSATGTAGVTSTNSRTIVSADPRSYSLSAMQYIEHLPRPPLDQWVKCVWTLADDASVDSARSLQAVVPDGCIEIVFHFADPFSRLSDGSEVRQPRRLIVGQTTGPTLLRPGSSVRALGIRLLPWGGTVLFQMPVCELTDKFLPIRELLPQFEALGDELAAAPANERTRIAFVHLTKCLSLERRGTLTTKLIGAIVGSGGRVTVRQLADTLNSTTRTVERVMRRDIGLPPLLFSRIVRVQEALGRMRHSPPRRFGQMAMDCGYYDQAHFCRDFRRLTGMSPTQFVGADPGLAHAFVYGDTP